MMTTWERRVEDDLPEVGRRKEKEDKNRKRKKRGAMRT